MHQSLEHDEPEAKASLIWIICEYAEKINNLQLQMLTVVVKLFLKKPDSLQGVVQAYIYWRLLSMDPGAAKAVVVVHRLLIFIPCTMVSPALLEEFIGEFSSLASVYHKPTETFIGHNRIGTDSVECKGSELSDNQAFVKAFQTVIAGQQAKNLLYFNDVPTQEGPSGLTATQILPSMQLGNTCLTEYQVLSSYHTLIQMD
ncbi:hypothetical protein J3A83DRAFT_4191196 [Scleroderma citrinum]